MFQLISDFFPSSSHSDCGQLSKCYFIVWNFSTNYFKVQFCLVDALKNFEAYCSSRKNLLTFIGLELEQEALFHYG